jgi:hypothetical protein
MIGLGRIMTRVDMQGIHRVTAKLADGSRVEYHYAWRGKGAPRFWSSASDIKVGSAEYMAALAAAAPKGTAAKGKFREITLAFLASGDFKALGDRYKDDLQLSIAHAKNGIDGRFALIRARGGDRT